MPYHTAILLVTTFTAAALAGDWSIDSEQWAAADALFRRDSRWRGADAANSIDLGNGRVLWTFGDSFISLDKEPAQRQRKTARFIRNSIAIQIGYDPTTAEFQPHWQQRDNGQPSAFFRGEDDVFFWPGGGLLADGKLLIFLMRIRNTTGGLGFAVMGWGAVLIQNPDDPPPQWQIDFISTPQNKWRVMVGSGTSLRQGPWIYAYSCTANPPHKIYLVRFAAAAALAGDLSQPQWWSGQKDRWRAQTELHDTVPQPVVEPGQTEFTVHHEPLLDAYVLTQFTGFPKTPIAIRTSQELAGPWSPMKEAFHPPESADDSRPLMVYAAKAHPEQRGQGLAVTYCTNTWNLASVRTDESVYYPRFFRLLLKSPTDAPQALELSQ